MAPLVEPRATTTSTSRPTATPSSASELYVNGDENHVPTDPEEQRHFFHGLMDAELCAAELMARNSHEHPEMPWDFHVDMARQCWDEIRHAECTTGLMADRARLPLGRLPDRLRATSSRSTRSTCSGACSLFNGTSEQKAMWRHSHRRKVLVELGQENDRAGVRLPARRRGPARRTTARAGASHLLGGDEKAYREKVRELRQALDRTGTPVSS